MFSAKKKHSLCKVIDRIVVKVCRNVLIKLLYFLKLEKRGFFFLKKRKKNYYYHFS